MEDKVSGTNTFNNLLVTTAYPDPSTGSASTASSGRESYLYNALGELIRSTDRNGTVHEFTYDVLGRRTSTR